MKYTAGQAAKATGVATATITRALKSGRISGIKDEKGTWMIDVAELHRVFPPLAAQDAGTPLVKHDATPKSIHAVAALERELDVLRETLSDVRTDRDKWRDMAERLSLAAPSMPIKAEPRKGIWTLLTKRILN
jgi:DNA-binding MurR/RpiR family transcriptional regulator